MKMKNQTLTRRPNLFNEICDIAMTNHYLSRNSYFVNTYAKTRAEWTEFVREGIERGDIKYPTFRKPTNHPKGYLTFLKYIASFEGGVKRRELMDHFGLKSVSFSIDKLMYAGFLTHCEHTHKYAISSFGRVYLAAVDAEFSAS